MKKYALVTGGSGGIGSAISKQLIEDGYTVYIHYNKSEEKIKELQKSLMQYSCASKFSFDRWMQEIVGTNTTSY